MKNKFYFSFLLVLGFSLLFSFNVSGANNNSTFSVHIKTDSKQLEEKLPYFHYKVKPDSTYTNTYILENKSNKPITVDIVPANAFTNPYASFNFSKKTNSDLSKFHNKKRLFSKFVKAPSSVKLEPNEIKELPITITTPPSIKDGEVIGGIIFEERGQKSNTTNGSTVLTSKINFIISTLLEYETGEGVELSFGEVIFNQKYAVPRIDAEIINENGSFLKDSTLTYKVYKNNGDFLFEGKLPLSRFSPSTNVLMPIQWNYKSLKPGSYYIDLRFTSKNGEFEPITNKADFDVTQEMLETHQVEYGEERIIPTINFNNVWTYVVVGLLVLGGVLVGFIIARRHERKLKAEHAKELAEKTNVNNPNKSS